jgi:hypothetical protein
MAIKIWSLFEKFKLSELNNNFAELDKRTSNINNTADLNKDVRSAEKLRNPFTLQTRPTSANLPIVADGSFKQFKATGSMTEGKPPLDGSILHFEWDHTGGYSTQLAIGNGEGKLYLRGMISGVWTDWKTVYTSLLDGSYTPTASNLGTITTHTAIRRGGVGRYKLEAKSGVWTGGTSYNLCKLSSNYRPVVAFSKRIMLTETINAMFVIGTNGNVTITPSGSINGSAFRIDETYTI